jgi:uncharacterized protein (TIGR02391 family)
MRFSTLADSSVSVSVSGTSPAGCAPGMEQPQALERRAAREAADTLHRVARTLLPVWPSSTVDSVCEVLADTDTGLTGGEIGRLLAKVGIPDIDPQNTKRHRLSNALVMKQQHDGAGNCVVRFIAEAMAPGLHFKNPGRRQHLQDGLNERMALMGLKVLESGKVARAAQTATTVDEAVRIAGRLRSELVRRGTHAEVLRYCEEELVRQSVFHAVFEAAKGLAARLRQISGSTLDGSELVNHCFGAKGGTTPVVRINSYVTKTDDSEHKGFANLLHGIFGTFRNPPAHAPRAAEEWTVTEVDALDLFSMLSYAHRRLDGARA